MSQSFVIVEVGTGHVVVTFECTACSSTAPCTRLADMISQPPTPRSTVCLTRSQVRPGPSLHLFRQTGAQTQAAHCHIDTCQPFLASASISKSRLASVFKPGLVAEVDLLEVWGESVKRLSWTPQSAAVI